MAVKRRLGLASTLLLLGLTASAEEPATQPEAMRVMQEFWDLVEANRHSESAEEKAARAEQKAALTGSAPQ